MGPISSGTTNRAEWAAFSREIKNRQKFPVQLSDYLARDKTDLFNLWLQNGQSLKKHLNNLSFQYTWKDTLKFFLAVVGKECFLLRGIGLLRWLSLGNDPELPHVWEIVLFGGLGDLDLAHWLPMGTEPHLPHLLVSRICYSGYLGKDSPIITTVLHGGQMTLHCISWPSDYIMGTVNMSL